MKNLNNGEKAGKILSTMLALVLTLSLVAGILPAMNPAFAESEFKHPSPFSKVGKASYYHNGRFTGNLIVNGVDISDWQSKKCDFSEAKADGVDFAILSGAISCSQYSVYWARVVFLSTMGAVLLHSISKSVDCSLSHFSVCFFVRPSGGLTVFC